MANKDIVAGGNLYPLRAQMGPLDASIGIVLKGNGKGHFTPLTYDQTGLLIDGDIRNIISIQTKKGLLLVAGKNEGLVQVVKLFEDEHTPQNHKK